MYKIDGTELYDYQQQLLQPPEKIPIWEKKCLTVEEAAAYFRVGENKLRKIISENQDAEFILWNGNRPQIKRKKFEMYIDRLNTI